MSNQDLLNRLQPEKYIKNATYIGLREMLYSPDVFTPFSPGLEN